MRRVEEREASSRVSNELAARLKQAGLFEALTEVYSPRFRKYMKQPKHILRHGWLLAPDIEMDETGLRAYVLGDQPGNDGAPRGIGQRLIIDRTRRVAILFTYGQGEIQEIRVDLDTSRVVDNRMIA
ncbi:MAG: hypothetical protein AB1758_26940 [Candidatus Eremiobacterota bacterium]